MRLFKGKKTHHYPFEELLLSFLTALKSPAPHSGCQLPLQLMLAAVDFTSQHPLITEM